MIERTQELEAHEAQLVNERDELMRQRNVMIERTQELEALAINTSEFDDIMRQRNAMIERAKELETHGSVVAHDRDDMMRQRNILLRRTQELEMRERALETHNRDLETNKTELEARMKDLDGCLSEVLQAFAERRRQHIIDLASTEHPDYGEKPPKQLWPWRSLNAEKRDRIRKLRDDYLTVLKSPLFDSEYYLTKYPDVAESGQDPILHYLRHGWHEGRWPSAAIDPVECENFFPELKQSQGNLVLRLIALLGPIVDEP
jgi:hypothetical protein